MEKNIKYEIAISETLHYLKGIKQEDIDKIPNRLIEFLQENSSKEYVCKFDYTKPLNELELQEETKGLIGMICLNYWCETEEQKKFFENKLNENEKKYQEKLREKYNPDNIFKNKQEETLVKNSNLPVVMQKETFFKKLISFIKGLFNRSN